MVMQHVLPSHPAAAAAEDSGNSSSSFILSRMEDETDVIACYEGVDVSTRSNTRDTSNTTREFDLDNTRQTVNTIDSILDFSKEDDDDDVSVCLERNHDNSILFGELHEFSPTLPSSSSMESHNPKKNIHTVPTGNSSTAKSTSAPPKKSIMDGLTLYSVTDSLVDSLCISTVCMTSNNNNNNNTTTTNASSSTTSNRFSQLNPSLCTSASSVTETGGGNWPTKPLEATCTTATTSPTSYVSVDVWQLLGCAASPVEAEMEEIWSLPTKDMIRQSGQNNTNIPPARASIKRRLKRIHGLRMERISGASRHGVTIGRHVRRSGTTETVSDNILHSRWHEPHLLGKSYSMLDDPLAGLIGKGIDPIPIEDDEHDGYDSDPEIINSGSNNNSFHSPQSSSSLYPQPALVKQHEVMQSEPLPFDETEMKISVQRSLNSTWTLTWHPNPDNVSQYNIPHKPICVNIWIERGSVIASSGVVVEPAFMWRDAYQPMLGQHKLNSSTQKPWSMRLLNACRITPCTTTIDRTKYPLARQQSSFFLKSCTGEEFLLEANGRTEVETITERWKLAVARFASLAVTEDVTGIAKEFFHPTVDSQMLTIPEDF